MNGALSSGITLDERKQSPFQYIREAYNISAAMKPSRVLVVGTAWFVYPMEMSRLDFVQHIDAVDIDPEIQWIAEEYFLEEPLDPKIAFHPISARHAVQEFARDDISYDVIFLDAYNGKSLPEELATQDFFSDVEKLLAPDGLLVVNMILDPDQETEFAHRGLATIHSVMGDIYSRNVSKNIGYHLDNHIITNKQLASYSPVSILPWAIPYTDDKNNAESDVVKMMYLN